MKLNHDCVRSVLLTVESMDREQILDSECPEEYEQLVEFDRIVVLYTIEKLIEAGFINYQDYSSLDGEMYEVTGLTWNGHHFLDNIRDDGVWKNTKTAAAKVAGVSLPILTEIAASFVKNKLGLN